MTSRPLGEDSMIFWHPFKRHGTKRGEYPKLCDFIYGRPLRTSEIICRLLFDAEQIKVYFL